MKKQQIARSAVREFEKEDRFKMNIVNCALLAAFVLNMPERSDVKRLTAYYAGALHSLSWQRFWRLLSVNSMEQIPFGKVSWFCHSKKVRISGTEDMAEYKDYLFHIRQSCIGMLLPACLLAGLLVMIF